MTEISPVQEMMLQIREENIHFIKKQYDLFRELQKRVLEEGIDYGFPAGKKAPNQKPSLYKSGAEKLTRLFNLRADFELVKEVERDDFIFYEFRCTLQTLSGITVGVGYGACNSREKSAWNSNPWMYQNTILKMAKKRAHVDAVLTGLGASNVFTQDIEDFQAEEEERTNPESAQQNTPPQESTGPQETLSDKQLRKIAVMMRQLAQLSDSSFEEVENEVKSRFNVQHLNELTKQKASEVIDYLQTVLDTLAQEGQGQ